MTTAPLSALLGHGGVFEGDLRFEGRVRLDGTWRGVLRTDDLLEVGPQGILEGRVEAARLVLAGRVEGEVTVRDLAVIEPTGILVGRLSAPKLEVRAGARLDATVEVPAREERSDG